ncbi:B-cell receptor CD22-like [Perca flavescens]|uniref:B-cell receptor CD22-like n=1 Tax=Perca flavescens TaxID=8167 RepID=UPI00106E7914|nr:B-cell receptor CD22-like [Perca flavescens]
MALIQGQSDWGVTYPSTPICALKRSTVDIPCTYRYPSTASNQTIEVRERFWFAKGRDDEPVDLKKDSNYTGRVQYHCDEKNCTLTITDLRERDSAEYKFRPPGADAPKLPSVSVSPSGEIEEGSSVTLTCQIDAYPAANYTWYKKNGNPELQPLSENTPLVFRSIQSSDSGEYYCTAENELGRRTSRSISIDVKYGPKITSVSVSPSAEIVEGSSVTLTCSSDANPAANYTWYKENEDSPKASGQIFTITDVRPEHSGNYYCEAQNSRGRQNSTLHLIVGAGNSTTIMHIIWPTVVVLMLIPLLLLSLWASWTQFRKKKTLSSTTKPHEPVELELDSCPDYENISDTAAKTEDPEEQEDLLDSCPDYENISDTAAKTEDPEEQEDLSDSCPVYGNI